MVVIIRFLISALLYGSLGSRRGGVSGSSQVRFCLRIVGAIFLEDMVIWAYESAAERSAQPASPTKEDGEKVRESETGVNVSKPKEDSISLLWRLVVIFLGRCFMAWAASLLTYEAYSCY